MNAKAILDWICGTLCIVICIAALVGLYPLVTFLPSSVEPLAGLLLFGAIIASLVWVVNHAEECAARRAS